MICTNCYSKKGKYVGIGNYNHISKLNQSFKEHIQISSYCDKN